MKNGWNIINQNFNGGEVTPYLRYRTDLNQYKNSCKTLSNFLITPQGAINRRGGTNFKKAFPEGEDDPYVDFTQETRLIPFEFGENEYCVFFLYHHKGGTFFDEDGNPLTDEKGEEIRAEAGDVYAKLIEFSSGNISEQMDIKTPFGSNIELDKLRYIQSYNVIYFVHPDAMPCRLERKGEGGIWDFNTNIITLPPFKDVPDQKGNRSCNFSFDESLSDDEKFLDNIKKSGLYKGECKVTLTESDGFGLANFEEGEIICIEYETGELLNENWKCESGTGIDYNYVSKAVPVCEKLRLDIKGGIWAGSVKLELSEDGGETWYTSGVVTSINGSSNEYIDRDIENPFTLARVKMTNRTKADDDSGCKFVLTSGKSGKIYAKVLSKSDGSGGNIGEGKIEILNHIPASVKSSDGKTIIADLKYIAVYGSCWNTNDGYPSSVSIFEERLTLAGTESEPHTIWLSETNNWDNFSRGTLETSPIKATLSCKSFEYITGMYAGQNLLILTNRGEYSFGARSSLPYLFLNSAAN